MFAHSSDDALDHPDQASMIAVDDGVLIPAGGDTAGLSNDYLNHYSEALMLIEMAAADPGIAVELQDWRPVDYRSYFAASRLRRAPAALRAYDALSPGRRAAFEGLTAAMDKLVSTAVLVLQPPCEPEDASAAVMATAPALRRMIELAASFLNSGGGSAIGDAEAEAAQAVADRLLERAVAD